MQRAAIEFIYEDEKIAQIVAFLLEIDNKIAPKRLKVETKSEGRSVVTHLEHEKLNTFIATIDDLLFSEKLISEMIAHVGHKSGAH